MTGGYAESGDERQPRHDVAWREPVGEDRTRPRVAPLSTGFDAFGSPEHDAVTSGPRHVAPDDDYDPDPALLYRDPSTSGAHAEPATEFGAHEPASSTSADSSGEHHVDSTEARPHPMSLAPGQPPVGGPPVGGQPSIGGPGAPQGGPAGPGGPRYVPGAPRPPFGQPGNSQPATGQPAISGPRPMPPGAQGTPPGGAPRQAPPPFAPPNESGQSGPRYGFGNQPSPYASQGVSPEAPPDDLGRQAAQAVQDLSSAQLLRVNKRTPQSGWRKAVYLATGRTVNLGESPLDTRRRELINRINQPLRGCYKIAMLSLKGGVGKTTTTTTLGSTFASLRGDRVIAVDANPDRGTLSQKIPLETTATVRHLLRDANRITKYSDVRSYTSQGPSRLEVLASEQDPAVSEAFSESDYRRTIDLLEHFYNIVLTDCGTGLMHSAMKGVLDIADSLIIVSSGSIDGARSASATLDWLEAHGYRDLVARSVAVINSVRPKSGKVNLDRLIDHFAARCRAVCRIPFDPHLEEGAEIELDQLESPTRLALLELAATVADDFPHDTGRL